MPIHYVQSIPSPEIRKLSEEVAKDLGIVEVAIWCTEHWSFHGQPVMIKKGEFGLEYNTISFLR